MKEQLISFETAKLTKEKGFDISVRSFFLSKNLHEDVNTKGNYNSYAWVTTWRNTSTDDTISAPTQSLLQKWLREKHNVHVSVDNNNHREKNKWCFGLHRLPVGVIVLCKRGDKTFSSYEEALEVGLQEALKLIN